MREEKHQEVYMGKYQEDSAKLLELIGGRSNIAAVSHCVTRMRFVLNDPSIADIKGIEAMKVVKGTFTQAGQFQVIIGNTVGEFYNDFTAVAGVEGVSKAAVKSIAKQNQNPLQRIMAALAEIFAPLIPALITGGLILGFRNCIDSLYLFDNGTKTLCDISQFWSGMDSFLWLIGEAVFHMLPVGICWSVTKKMGTTQILGIILGLTLVSGQLMNAYSVASATEIPYWDFGFFKINMIGYQAQVIPAILAAFTLVYLEKFFTKISPAVVSMIVVPFCSLLLAVVAAHFILGPIGWKIGSAISTVVYAGIAGRFKVIFGAIFGFVYAPLVITGLHHMSNAIDMQLIASFGGTMLWPMIALSNIAQGSAVLGMIFLQRKNAEKQEVNIPSCISCYLGVTEPAMFGVNLKYMFPFLCGMIGSSCAAIVCTATSTTANAIGVGGLPGLLSIQPAYWLSFLLCMAIAIAVPFTLTVIVGKKKGVDKEAAAIGEEETADQSAFAATDVKELKACLSGKVIDITEVPDKVFSNKVLGDGIAIEPVDNVLVAPADGVISVVMDGNNHAVGMTLGNGMEVLMHIGLDTVAMNGDGFTCHVKEKQAVKAGDKLITFDPAKIRAAGYPTTTMLVITEKAGKKLRYAIGDSVQAGKDIVVTVED